MLEPNEQETKVGPPVLPTDGISDGGHLAEDLAIAKKMKQKSRNEAHLTAGCGYTSKKALLLNTFWGEMWPELQKIGWQKVRRLKQTDLIRNSQAYACCPLCNGWLLSIFVIHRNMLVGAVVLGWLVESFRGGRIAFRLSVCLNASFVLER